MATLTLPIADLQPGMTLAQPIVDNKGRTIVPEGTRLTPMAINHLGKWGVSEVRIQKDKDTTVHNQAAVPGALPASASEQDVAFMRRVAEEVARRFANLPPTDLNNELRRVALKNLITHGRGTVPGL